MTKVLLYYKLIRIKHPEAEVKRHREVCQALQLKGRVLIGPDGINGTISGSPYSVELYKDYLNQHKLFKNIDFKENESTEDPFPKMKVKARQEIITTEARDEFELARRGQHIDRDTFHHWLQRGEDMVLLDMRNDYEWEIGRFVNSVAPPMKYFRELKDHLEFYKKFKDKKIVMFCTGGIRCEPASALFIEHGFDPKNLYQLEGGIVKYAEKYGNDGFYEGKCFVFDDRMAVEVNTSPTAKVIGNCRHCQASNDTYRNCANKYCNLLFLACDDCNQKTNSTCSTKCRATIERPENIRPPVKMLHRNK